MSSHDDAPVACTLQAGDYQARLAWIGDLARDGLTAVRRTDLRLELTYAAAVADRVRQMVHQEQQCCAFLEFDLVAVGDGLRLTIVAPERARAVADALFAAFVPVGTDRDGRAPIE